MKYQTLDNFIRTTAAEANDPEGKYLYTKLLRLTLAATDELSYTMFPNIVSYDLRVQENGTLLLPEGTIGAVYVAQVKNCGGKRLLFPFGFRKNTGQDRTEFLTCDAEDIGDDICSCTLPNYSGGLLGFYVANSFYREQYGLKSTRFFGFYSHDEANGRLDLFGANPDDLFVVSVKVQNEDYKLIPIAGAEVLRSRVLQRHYAASNPNLAAYHFDQFKRNIRMYKHSEQNLLGIDEWVDAIRSEQSNAIR